jgi:hypothetical protein
MKRGVLILFLAITGCALTPQDRLARQFGYYDNSCLPTAIAFREGLKSKDVWSEVLVYQFVENGATRGHAMCVYTYPSKSSKVWTYDMWGSYRSPASTNNPLAIAKVAHTVRNNNGRVVWAEFLE